jgi:hypothetical protein
VWLALSTLVSIAFFLNSERPIELASHEATVRADFSGEVVVRTGPVLPDLRTDTGSLVGVEIELGKTDAASVGELTQRYAAIASSPEAPIAKVEQAVLDIAIDSVARGLALGALPVLVWVLIGQRRRREIVERLPTRDGIVGLLMVALVVIGLAVPWRGLGGASTQEPEAWISLSTFVGASVPLPEELDGIEVRADATTGQTRRLVASAIDSYRASTEFYDDAAETAAGLELRQPEEDESVVLLVSDRHDNVGMDPVAEAIAEAGGATAVFDAGDDTSTGKSWEAFSLDSLAETFSDYDRWAVAGNHDHGSFVRSYLSDLGWTYFDGEVTDGPADSRILGVDDPRSSGLGNWRDETDLTFDEVRERLAEAACDADADGDRVGTLLVHDANLGSEALARGCVDLVVGGHTHVTDGPTAVRGSNEQLGYTYTVGTTGGAAYAIAIGTKLRRPAAVALITYRDGRPVGIQSITIQTTGRFDVAEYVELTY